MRKFKCHKHVWAIEIGVILGTIIHAKHGDSPPVDVGPDFINKHDLNLPGYLVIYADGYRSFSPKDVFEAGYSAVDQ